MSIIARLENTVLKELFHIKNDSSKNAPEVLSLRVGEKHISFSVTDKSGTELYELAYGTAGVWNENELINFLAAYPALNSSFLAVLVAYDYPQSIVIPSADIKQEEAGILLNTLYHNNQLPVVEAIPHWQLYNVFAAPKEIQEWVSKKFPAAKSGHQYSLETGNVTAADSSGIIQVDFRKDDFTILVARESKLLLANAFEYSTPEDVLYFLLKICQQFSLQQQEVELQLSGLIDKKSTLYNELYQYFIHVKFREASWNAQGEYPAHFFTSLNDLARCVS